MLSSSEDYYGGVKQSFDGIARTYDIDTGGNEVFRLMKKSNLAYIMETARPGDKILEIGCGTGDDAIALARAGAHVVATDISEAMIDITKEKAELAGLTNLEAFTLPASSVGFLEDAYGKRYFDGACSSFGALNCEPDLVSVDAGLELLIAPDGYFLCSIMNKYALNEILLNLALLRYKTAFRRLKSPIWAPIGMGLLVKTHYYTGRAFSDYFKNFILVDSKGLSVFVPPPYLSGHLKNKPGLLDLAGRMDAGLSHLAPLNRLGDHIMLKFRKAGGKR